MVVDFRRAWLLECMKNISNQAFSGKGVALGAPVVPFEANIAQIVDANAQIQIHLQWTSAYLESALCFVKMQRARTRTKGRSAVCCCSLGFQPPVSVKNSERKFNMLCSVRRICVDQLGGVEFDAHGQKRRKWNWKDQVSPATSAVRHDYSHPTAVVGKSL